MLRNPRIVAAGVLPLLLAASTFAATPADADGDGSSLEELRATVRLDEIRRDRDRYESARLVEQAVREEMAGRDVQAEALYARAFELDSSNERAREGLQDVRERLGLRVAPSPLIDRAGRDMRAKRQQVRYHFDAAVGAARDAIATGEPKGFQAARLHIDRARLLKESNQAVFSVEESRALDAQVRTLETNLKLAIQRRDDAIRQAEHRETLRRLREARAAMRNPGL